MSVAPLVATVPVQNIVVRLTLRASSPYSLFCTALLLPLSATGGGRNGSSTKYSRPSRPKSGLAALLILHSAFAPLICRRQRSQRYHLNISLPSFLRYLRMEMKPERAPMIIPAATNTKATYHITLIISIGSNTGISDTIFIIPS